MSDAHAHLTETRVRLTTSPVMRTFSVLEERTGLDYGYLRARVELVNQDFLELAEYFVIRNDAVEVQRYRYQWMDSRFDRAARRGAWQLIGTVLASQCAGLVERCQPEPAVNPRFGGGIVLVTLTLNDDQVLALVRQLPEERKNWLLRALVSDQWQPNHERSAQP